ncbi:MAG: polysaccharide biosynthesis/export family protein [Bacteroidota bacterium]
MFRFDENFTEEDLTLVTDELDRNYLLKPNDVLQLNVFTNKGERLIDPNFEFSVGNAQGGQQQQLRDRFQYVIQADSIITFPLVGDMNVVGLTLYKAELKVAAEFENYYEEAFVKLRINNRRVFVLGAPGGNVIPLQNENTTIIEVLALAQGIDRIAKVNDIRVIRGREVFLVDLSTISGMRNTNLIVQPGDIVYVEPWRRPWLESIRDASPLISIISSAITLALVIQNL